MKIMTFSAPDMRGAMDQVAQALGPDVVILETRETDNGVDIVAAAEFDPESWSAGQELAQQAPPQPEEPVAVPEPAPPAVSPPDPANSADLGLLRDEMGAMRRLLQDQVSSLSWAERARRSPAEAQNMRNLSSLGLAPDQVERLLPHLAGRIAPENLWSVTLGVVGREIPVLAEDLVEAGGIFAFAGPTGVGKTTTVAKLAARFAMKHGSQAVALVTTDNYRIGAREQIETFAKILGAPVFRTTDVEDLASTLQGLSAYPLVLVDTAGMSQRDMRLTEQLKWIRQADASIRLVLTLAANAQAEMLQEVVDSFAGCKPAACVLTKVDEAASLGGALSVLMRSQLPLAYVANGQKVPEDMFAAAGNEDRLTRICAALMRRSRRDINEEDMAKNFGEVDIHVCA